jgi:hypothetical protein
MESSCVVAVSRKSNENMNLFLKLSLVHFVFHTLILLLWNP